ncbi:MAG TPA: hypothetical protein VJR24_14205 [Gemmatimonadaceae bacterium]|nr:hypothetical protein [Gemmatimonadaceae bacterium]
MVDPDVVEFAQVMAVIGVFGVCMIGCIVGGMTILKRRPRERPPLDDNRLQRLEQAVDAIAVEVERISEGQRFTTKLLAQRQGDGAAEPADPVRVPRSDQPR